MERCAGFGISKYRTLLQNTFAMLQPCNLATLQPCINKSSLGE